MAASETTPETIINIPKAKPSSYDEIKHTLDIFIEPEATCELRFLGYKRSYKSSGSNGGFFDNMSKMAEVANTTDQTPEYEDIYFTLNPISRDLLGRAYNKMIVGDTTGKLTKTENVLKRRWMLVDVDIAGKMAGIPSRDSEHSEALEVADKFRHSMNEKYGWPMPVYADSGNGAHLDYRIDLPNDDENTELIRNVLICLNKELDHPKFVVDEATFDANRVNKLYGTMVRKGDEVDDRHLRRSHIIDVPEELIPITKDQLESFVAAHLMDGNGDTSEEEEEPESDTDTSSSKSYSTSGHIDDMGKWLNDHGIEWEHIKTADNNGTMYVMKCPVCKNADKSCEVSAYLPPKDGYHAVCKHSSCKVKSWTDFRKAVDPDYVARKPKSKDKDSTSKILVNFVLESGAELRHTAKEDFYITVNKNGHQETYPLRTKAAKLWIGSLFYKHRLTPPSSQAYQDAFVILEGMALYEGKEQEAYVRVAPYEDRVYVDLGDTTWRAIEITRDGWKIVDKAPVRFWRPKTMKPLVIPTRGGKWEDLRNLINAKQQKNWILVIAFAIQVYWPVGSYAHHNFNGEQGSGKTFAQIILKMLLDPSSTPLRRPPKDDRDVIIAATNERMPSFDNLSGMPEHLSDTFCGLSTGVSFGARALYTDGDEAILGAKAPCMMNGIDTLSDRSDLLDRTIINDLPRIKKEDRTTEKKIMAKFRKVQAELLGLFLDATVTGLRRLPEIENQDLELPRMADFCQWVMACEPSLPWKAGEFMTEYQNAIAESLNTVVESDLVAKAVYDMAMNESFTGNATELLNRLNSLNYVDSQRPPKGWPRTASYLSSRIRRAAPTLRAMGVHIEMDRSNQNRAIEISNNYKKGSTEDPKKKKTENGQTNIT